jgi:flagellar hook protein FlgE
MYTAVSGLNSFQNALTIVSDDVANANTTAYKSNTALFGDLVSGYMSTSYVDTKAQGAGSTLLGTETNFGVGNAMQTGNWSDVMLQGGGYFNVKDTSGGLYYTRDGAFRIDANGFLTDQHGYQVIGSDGNPITMETDPKNPTHSSYSIDKFGVVNGALMAGGSQVLGTLKVTNFPNQDGLIRMGQNLYTPGPTAGPAVDGTANVGQSGQLVSGALEGSNVDIGTQMVNMIIYQADYQANSKAIQSADTCLQTVVNLIR